MHHNTGDRNTRSVVSQVFNRSIVPAVLWRNVLSGLCGCVCAGKHEAIVKNMHELLTKLAWDFSSDQLDHLFELIQRSWNPGESELVPGMPASSSVTRKQREKLLELIRRLAEDDKEGKMAQKVHAFSSHTNTYSTECIESNASHSLFTHIAVFTLHGTYFITVILEFVKGRQDILVHIVLFHIH